MDVLILTYDIVQRVPPLTIQQEHQILSATNTDWAKLCRVVMLEYVLGSSQKIGGRNKMVEIDENNFGRHEYNRGHKVKGQWVFDGVESKSGKDVSSSRSGENRQHIHGCSSLLDGTRHCSHQ